MAQLEALRTGLARKRAAAGSSCPMLPLPAQHPPQCHAHVQQQTSAALLATALKAA